MASDRVEKFPLVSAMEMVPLTDLKQLRYFLAAARHGSISAAAKALCMAPATLSENIAKLEKSFGTQLAVRGLRGLTLTTAGSVLAERGPDLIAAASSLALEVGRSSRLEGSVTVALPPSPNVLIGTALAETIHAELPGIRLRVSEVLSGDAIEWVESERVDFGLIYEPPGSSDFDFQLAFREEMFIVAAPDFLPNGTVSGDLPTIEPARLAGLPFVLPSVKHNARRIIERLFRKRQLLLNTVSEIELLSQVMEMVIRASAYSVLPRCAVLQQLERGELVLIRVAEEALWRTCYVVRKRWRPVTAPCLAVEAAMTAIFGEMNKRFSLDLAFAPLSGTNVELGQTI